MKSSKKDNPDTMISLLCVKCKRQMSESDFYSRWVQEVRAGGRDSRGICLDCMEKVGLYICKSCGEKLAPENFSLARAKDWPGKDKSTLRRVLSEDCFSCQIRELEGQEIKSRQDHERLKQLRSGRFSAVLQAAKRRGMSYGQYQALLFSEQQKWDKGAKK